MYRSHLRKHRIPNEYIETLYVPCMTAQQIFQVDNRLYHITIMYIYIHIHVYIYIYLSLSIYIYIYMYICNVCIYIYIYINKVAASPVGADPAGVDALVIDAEGLDGDLLEAPPYCKLTCPYLASCSKMSI